MKMLTCLLLFCCWISVSQGQSSADWMQLILKDSHGNDFALSSLSRHPLTIILFLDRECPVTQKYGAVIRRLYQQYQEENIGVVAVYPLPDMTPKIAREFANEYQYTFPQLVDPHQKLTHALGAAVTPEVFLVNSQGEKIYHGAIDNWFYELGRYRKVITENYLEDAITAYLDGKNVAVKETQAIGCLIGPGKIGEMQEMHKMHKNQ